MAWGTSLSLGQAIAMCEAADQDKVLPFGITHPHSYRGFYEDVAFERTEPQTVREFVAVLRSALGQSYEGWKGGHYTMDEHSDAWFATEGSTSDSPFSRLLFEVLLDMGHSDGGPK